MSRLWTHWLYLKGDCYLSDTFRLKKNKLSNSGLARHWSCTMETLQRMCLKLVVSENRAQWKHRCQMCQNECGTLIQNRYVLKNMSLTVLKTLLLPYFWLNPQQIWNVHLSVTVSCWPVTTAACNPCSRAWCVTVFRFWLWATTPSRREIIRSTWDFEMYSGYRWAGKGLTLIFFSLSLSHVSFSQILPFTQVDPWH